MKCPQCGERAQARARYCSQCGGELGKPAGLDDCKALLHKGAVSEALEQLQALGKKYLADAAVQRWWGHALFYAGRASEALEQYRRSASLDPRDWEAHYQVGTMLLAKQETAEALPFLLKAVACEPDPENSPLASLLGLEKHRWQAAACLALGLAQHQSGQEEPALLSLIEATKLDDANPLAWGLLGDLSMKRSDYPAAIQAYESALGAASEGPSALALRNDLGVACFRSGQVDKAEVAFKEVIRLDPKNENAIHNLGLLYVRQGMPENLHRDLAGHLKAEEAAGVMASLARTMVASAKQDSMTHDPSGLVGRSAAMEQVHERIRRAAGTTATVLVLGENGTGKELVAHAIHAASARAGKPFVAVHCAALPETLLESELFGYEKGAFTGAYRAKPGRFELAEGGTLFLDEIGDLDLGLQVKLLRVLQEREFERLGGTRTQKADVRMIAATNMDLKRKVSEGRFREDLYYRLFVIPIQLPALRQRKEDIPELARHFVQRFTRRLNKRFAAIHPDALVQLLQHDWPGNVRELENTIERAVALYDDTMVLAEYLGLESKPDEIISRQNDKATESGFGELAKAERDLLIKQLEKAGFKVDIAAQAMGISRRTFYRKMLKFGLKEK
jgi:DNA-binding NtrC family response regulator/tetratricopeptide (TPR) repeat protein